jgi:hypothetical protein
MRGSQHTLARGDASLRITACVGGPEPVTSSTRGVTRTNQPVEQRATDRFIMGCRRPARLLVACRIVVLTKW